MTGKLVLSPSVKSQNDILDFLINTSKMQGFIIDDYNVVKMCLFFVLVIITVMYSGFCDSKLQMTRKTR